MIEKHKQVPWCATVLRFVTETGNRLDQMVVIVLPSCFRVAKERKVKDWQRVNRILTAK